MAPKLRHAPKARGVLAASRPIGGGHVRYLPSLDLAALVAHFWIVRWEVAEPAVVGTLPHPTFHLVVEDGRARILGVPTRRFTRTLEGEGRVFGVKFRPGSFRPFLRAPASSLTDRVVPAGRIFGSDAAGYAASVRSTDDDASLVTLAESFLRARLPSYDAGALAEVHRLVERAERDRSLTRVEALAAWAGASTRTLQRTFLRWVGVSPKWVIRRYRLHEALERVDAGGAADWAGLAVELGYFDQAHFIRDFRALVGASPAAYAKRAATGAAAARASARSRART